MITERDFEFMQLAVDQAKLASDNGEVPVGAVIVRYGTDVISAESNFRENGKNALYHAEVRAIDSACRKLGGWRLPECTMYVTLEPCPMCAGAIINSRIDRVVFGAYDKRAGAMGSVLDINSYGLNHTCEVEGGVLEEECVQLLQAFFRKKRKN